MPQALIERLDEVQVGEARRHGALTVFPLLGERQGALRYLLLEEAVRRGAIEIGELEPASVGELIATVLGGDPVLIVDGEELVGGRQNRLVNSTVLLPQGKTVLPVSCVEQGRWRESGDRFTPKEAGYPSLRAAKAAHVAQSLRESGRHVADQGEVWSSIGRRQSAEGIRSDTAAMTEIYEQKRADLGGYERAIPYPAGAVGMVVALGGRIASLELFDSPATLATLWSRLIRAAAVDALVLPQGSPVARSRALRLTQRPKEATLETFASPGLGGDVRITGGGVAGSALLHESVVVHTALFRTRSSGSGGRIASQSVRRQLRRIVE